MSKELKALNRKIRKILNDNYGNKKDHGQTVKQLAEMIVKNYAVLPIVVESKAIVCPKCKSEHIQKRGYKLECTQCWHTF